MMSSPPKFESYEFYEEHKQLSKIPNKDSQYRSCNYTNSWSDIPTPNPAVAIFDQSPRTRVLTSILHIQITRNAVIKINF